MVHSDEQKHQEACVDEQRAPCQTQTQKESIQRVELKVGNLGEALEVVTREATKPPLEVSKIYLHRATVI